MTHTFAAYMNHDAQKARNYPQTFDLPGRIYDRGVDVFRRNVRNEIKDGLCLTVSKSYASGRKSNGSPPVVQIHTH